MIFKKQIGLVVVAILATTTLSFAQTFSLTPNDSINTTGVLEDLQTLSIQQPNISSDTIILKWKKISESVPPLWDASICDNSICNTSLVDSGMMNPVVPLDYGLLLIHITPHVNYGTAIVRYAVWDIANPNLKDTLTYILTSTATSGIAEEENKNAFSIFPNPAKDFISINTNNNKNYSVNIFNSVGEKIYSTTQFANCTLPIANWNNGIYEIEIFSENKIIGTQKIIIQK